MKKVLNRVATVVISLLFCQSGISMGEETDDGTFIIDEDAVIRIEIFKETPLETLLEILNARKERLLESVQAHNFEDALREFMGLSEIFRDFFEEVISGKSFAEFEDIRSGQKSEIQRIADEMRENFEMFKRFKNFSDKGCCMENKDAILAFIRKIEEGYSDNRLSSVFEEKLELERADRSTLFLRTKSYNARLVPRYLEACLIKAKEYKKTSEWLNSKWEAKGPIDSVAWTSFGEPLGSNIKFITRDCSKHPSMMRSVDLDTWNKAKEEMNKKNATCDESEKYEYGAKMYFINFGKEIKKTLRFGPKVEEILYSSKKISLKIVKEIWWLTDRSPDFKRQLLDLRTDLIKLQELGEGVRVVIGDLFYTTFAATARVSRGTFSDVEMKAIAEYFDIPPPK
ncbi:MAG: hypothetical protein LBS83_00635 [Holosporales bacterium]|jgi:hypothetical protein|nr:hypothetical protein [Holosporales bacterium]